jgi:membrane-anchored protein YejM (alkaline phosphatase superfamily)
MYANAAANVDRAVGRLLEGVKRHRGAAPAVVVVADHGESLFDEGFLGHGYAINDVQTRIPLIVRGLPFEACEPIGQADVRDAISAALARDVLDTRPAFQDCGRDRHVFQYLGSLDRPRAIAWTANGRRVIWDFRQYRARFDEGPWLRERDLDEEGRRVVGALVHAWERMRLAQHEAAR